MSQVSNQVSAKVIAHSKSSVTGKEMITFEWEYPRIILAEVNTHKALNKNASSSRAIPVATINNQVRNFPAMPVRFGAKNSGMQDAGPHDALIKFSLGTIEGEYTPEEFWHLGANIVADISDAYDQAGYAKQVCNRWTEVAQRMKQVVTGTEFNNFFWLRDHHMADPTIEALAKAAKKALSESTPVILNPGDWHVPYFGGEGVGYWLKGCGIPLEDALTISASCTAQVSYRKLDDTMEKAKGVVARLNLHGEEPDDPVHASPLEHQGTPIAEPEQLLQMNPVPDNFNAYAPTFRVGKVNVFGRPDTWQEGITHMDRDGMLCSGNLKGFIQHRQLVPNHVKKG